MTECALAHHNINSLQRGVDVYRSNAIQSQYGSSNSSSNTPYLEILIPPIDVAPSSDLIGASLLESDPDSDSLSRQSFYDFSSAPPVDISAGCTHRPCVPWIDTVSISDSDISPWDGNCMDSRVGCNQTFERYAEANSHEQEFCSSHYHCPVSGCSWPGFDKLEAYDSHMAQHDSDTSVPISRFPNSIHIRRNVADLS